MPNLIIQGRAGWVKSEIGFCQASNQQQRYAGHFFFYEGRSEIKVNYTTHLRVR